MPSSSPASSRMRCTRPGGSNASPTFLAGSTMVRSSSERGIAPSRTCRVGNSDRISWCAISGS